jgi:acetolactate synthase-1/2/3 large subunit
VSDDSVTAGPFQFMATANAAKHTWLYLTGGAIGQGLPLAIGAAIASPGRSVIALSGDGSAMYTLQALWTIARERLPIVTIIFANRRYQILSIEMARTSADEAGPTADALLSLSDPTLDWVKLAEGQGVQAERCETAEDFDAVLSNALAAKAPFLIEAAL